ncbi:hypothetical protein J4470_00730 [Candidatus Woesearchaeota archaeon]|nr:hypothetical protein [Candidatus Woesearchaeota archaeon]
MQQEQHQIIRYDIEMSRQLLNSAFLTLGRRKESDLNGLELLAKASDERVIDCVNAVLDELFSLSNIGLRTREIFELVSGIADGARYRPIDLSQYYESQGYVISRYRIKRIYVITLGELEQPEVKSFLESRLEFAPPQHF